VINFQALKAGLADAVVAHTCTVTEFLQGTSECISKFVLLDHMDWMSSYYPEVLAEEWTGVLDRATPDARVIFRVRAAIPSQRRAYSR
jgi:S-adenosylmethionine-diacylglycerol 3-amino-3-carboxypropyl transferase